MKSWSYASIERAKFIPRWRTVCSQSRRGRFLPKGGPVMLKPENQSDKERFNKLKDHEIDRGRDEEEAKQIAASEVKQLRDQEGKNKH
jgi:hypothetical protein